MATEMFKEGPTVPPIDCFQGTPLSNFWPCSVKVGKEGFLGFLTYRSSEHAYKANLMSDREAHDMVMACPTAGQAKRLGKKLEKAGRSILKGKRTLQVMEIKLHLMETVCRAKFLLNSDLGLYLKETGKAELIEGNVWGDVFWGVCQEQGRNHLGRILMKIRDEL